MLRQRICDSCSMTEWFTRTCRAVTLHFGSQTLCGFLVWRGDWLKAADPKTLHPGLCVEFEKRFPGCRKILYFEPGKEGLLVGQYLHGAVSFGIVQMVSGRSGWSSFPCTHLGIVSPFAGDCLRYTWEYFWWRWEERKDGSWVVWTALVNHMVLCIFEFTLILNIFHALVLDST